MPNSTQSNAYNAALTSGIGVIRDQLGDIAVVGAKMTAGVAAGNVLASDANGNLTLQPMPASGLPSATTTTQGAVILDGTATDITADGAQAAGGSGKAADGVHVHPGRDYYMRASTILGETISRAGQMNTSLGLSSGTVQMAAMFLPAGVTIGHLATSSGSSPINGPTHWWFGLYDNNLAQLAVTADQTNTAWAANTPQSLAIATIASGASAAFTTTYTGLYYFGVLATWSSSGPNIMGVAHAGTGLTAQAPVLCGISDTGQTTPPSFPHTATAITAGTGLIYGSAAT